jgi:2-oxoglutarate dehydrogenase E1 component
MGAWRYWYCRFGQRVLGKYPLSLAARSPSGSPATGSASSHKLEQQEVFKKAFGTDA